MSGVVNGTPVWVMALLEDLQGRIPKEFVGQVEINVFKGGISNINIKQSFKKEVTQ